MADCSFINAGTMKPRNMYPIRITRLLVVYVIVLCASLLAYGIFADNIASATGNHTNVVRGWYQTCHGTDGDAGGRAYWAGELDKNDDHSHQFARFVDAGGCPGPPVRMPAPTCTVWSTATNVARGGTVTVYWNFSDTRLDTPSDRGSDVPGFDRSVIGQSTFTVNSAATYSFFATNRDHAVRTCGTISITISEDDHALATDCLSAAASKVTIRVEYRDINTGQLINTNHGVNVSANRGTRWCTKAGYTSKGWSVSDISPPISPGPFEQNFRANKTFNASGGVLNIEVDCMGPTTIGNVNVNIAGYTRIQNYNPPDPSGNNGNSYNGTVYYQKDVSDDDDDDPDDTLPFCMIWGVKPVLSPGEKAVIVWYSSDDVTSASLWDTDDRVSRSVGSQNILGVEVEPSITTTYRLTVYSPGGSYTCFTTIDVADTPPESLWCELVPSKVNAEPGEKVTLTWASNGILLTIDGVSRLPATGGSTEVTITKTTTFTATVTAAGDGKTSTCQATVFVNPVGPYHKVHGGDVSVGGGFGEACQIEEEATILAFNKIKEGNHVGAGTQLAAYALGVINGFGTSQVRTPTSRKQLTFANAVAGDFGGELHQKHVPCIPDYWAGVSRAQTAPNNNSLLNDSGVKKISADKIDLKGKNLAKRERITLYVEGDVRISENITYAGGSYANLADIPSFRLIVKGNIYVDPDVTELNGTFVAMPKDDDSSGKFYTCSPDYRPPSANEVANQCNELLTVYGAVIADTIKFTRSRGTVNDAVVGERYNNNSGRPAEKFIYTPESWLTSDFGGTGDNDSFGSLPPVL